VVADIKSIFPALRTLRLCVNQKTKSRKAAKDRKEKKKLIIAFCLVKPKAAGTYPPTGLFGNECHQSVCQKNQPGHPIWHLMLLF